MALTDGLISYYSFDGNSNDAHGSNNGTDTSITYPAGLIGDAADLNAASDNISVADNASLEVAANSISFWVKSTETGAFKNMLGRYTGASQRVFSHIFNFSAGRITFIYYDTSNNNTGTSSNSGVVNDGSWHHVVGVCEGDGTNLVVTVYTDGSATYGPTVQGGTTNSLATGSTTPLTIGGPNGISAQGAIFTIDEMGYWDRALTGAEVTELYNSGAGLSYADISGGGGGYRFNPQIKPFAGL